MSRRRTRPELTGWQKQLVAELRALATNRPDEIRVLSSPTLQTDGTALIRVSLRTAELPHEPGGLELKDDEEFLLRLRSVPLQPPSVEVDHTRFLGFPHVLQGQRLCVYLDPSREWRPTDGMSGFLRRVWDWLADAAAGKFDAATAMYHAVGGVLHQAEDTPTIVVRETLPARAFQAARLVERTPQRLDLTYQSAGEGHRTPVVALRSELPFGAASTLALFLTLLDDPYLDAADGRPSRVSPQSPAFLTALLAAAARNPKGTPQYFVVAVPHPAGGPHHLLGGRLPADTADVLRQLAATRGVDVTIDPATINTDIAIEWCTISDERSEVTTRRDDDRPVSGFRGKTVLILGCGGLGSWVAEFVARAGAAEIAICDPGNITGGLLVRQNYGETDIGRPKAQALATRLRQIRDELIVTPSEGLIPDDLSTFLAADLIVDATVSLAITAALDVLSDTPGRRAKFAQVATDAASGMLGLLHLTTPGDGVTLSRLDELAGQSVLADAQLEAFHPLWQNSHGGDELVPTRGCSVPTFHGSAADLAAVAANLVNLIGLHLAADDVDVPGTHLVATPYASRGAPHRFLPASG
ncbi:ThiF family adenylyltransferase [Microbacterium jejuense]|uniref:ThiF family adenylyltransferase n=1 Tax=Microbacterium jejuense TaxID=1263637 RepID=A0ABS7HJH5_9MICO|nr:ThiF family adenylyltransferase [Microbacterium jejuense]MBW9093052.1 ThiF family adenylyltransferase [Microbacterium jejuense]